MRKHGKTGTPEHDAWARMTSRCRKETRPDYKNYGGRGIRVCEEWRASFEAFLRDMGPRPSAQHSLDRIDVNGNYEPGNCRWATLQEQARNKRSNVVLTHDGCTMTLAEWAERVGMPYLRLYNRLLRGWPVERALTTVGKAPRHNVAGWQRTKTTCLRGHPLEGKNLILRGTKRGCRACSNESHRRYDERRRAREALAALGKEE